MSRQPLAYVFEPYRLTPSKRLLARGETTVKLGGRAFDVLVVLVERRDRTVGKDELMDLVWPKVVVEENNLQVQIVALRKLLGHPAISTVPGRGYRFTLPVQVEGDAGTDRPTGQVDSAPATVDRRTNLPESLPALYGREHDLATLRELVDRHDLVTVAGPGGIGKTRLAQAIAAEQAAKLPGGAWWIDLASLAESGLLANTVILALGIVPDAREPVSLVIQALRSESALLVLDNAEHLLEAVADFIARLRSAAPGVRVLVTSQEVLHLAGEQVFRPEPLALPDGDDPERVASSGAVELFIARARAADRNFALTEDNSGAIADVCRRLDGIPLAIELAAARLPLLGIEGLRSRLNERLKVLTTGDRQSLRRHQTLRAAIEWSHSLLTPAQQAVLRRLGVFAGGFTLDAAQQVASDDESIDPWDVLEHLGALVDKSLVRTEGEGTPRCRMLETTRLFALERLIESGEAAIVRTRHLEHFLELAEEGIARMLVGNRLGLAFFDRERDNILLALAWRPGYEDGGAGLRLAAATRYYWTSRGLLTRGLEAMRSALAQAGEQGPSSARSHVLGSAAHFESLMGNPDVARRDIDKALQEARLAGDLRSQCVMLSAAGFISLKLGDIAGAKSLALEASTIGRQLGDGHELGNALSLTAAVHLCTGELDLARSVQQEAVALRQRLHHSWSEAVCHINLAQMAVDADDPWAALPHLLRVIELMAVVDSEQIGVYLLGVTADWCAALGLSESAAILEAAKRSQYQRVGMHEKVDAKQAIRFESAVAKIGVVERERLQRLAQAFSYGEAMKEVRERLLAQASLQASPRA